MKPESSYFFVAQIVPALFAADFNFGHAAGATIVVALVVAAVLTVCVLLPGFALWGGATLLGTAFAIATVSMVLGVAAGVYVGLRTGAQDARAQAEQVRQQRVEEIRSISHRIDMYFEPREDDPEEAKDFVCWLVTYDETNPQDPEAHEQVIGRDIDQFYQLSQGYLEDWLTLRLGRDRQETHYELHVFMDEPFGGEGNFTRIKSIADQLQLETKRHDAKWTSPVLQ